MDRGVCVCVEGGIERILGDDYVLVRVFGDYVGGCLQIVFKHVCVTKQQACTCVRQEVASGVADGNTVQSDNKGKGAHKSFICFGLA